MPPQVHGSAHVGIGCSYVLALVNRMAGADDSDPPRGYIHGVRVPAAAPTDRVFIRVEPIVAVVQRRAGIRSNIRIVSRERNCLI